MPHDEHDNDTILGDREDDSVVADPHSPEIASDAELLYTFCSRISLKSLERANDPPLVRLVEFLDVTFGPWSDDDLMHAPKPAVLEVEFFLEGGEIGTAIRFVLGKRCLRFVDVDIPLDRIQQREVVGGNDSR